MEKRSFTQLSEIKPQKIEWLWPGHIPLGALTVCEGDPGGGKSGVLFDLAARVTTAREMPDGTPGVDGGVLLCLAEDCIARTVLPRLEAAQADAGRIAVMNDEVSLPDSIAELEKVVAKTGAKLLVIDPLMAFLGPNASGDQNVRKALTPLGKMAERHNLAVVVIRHLNKSGGRHSLYRGSGSIGIIAAARSALVVAKAPDDDNMQVLAQSKCNFSALAPSLLFEVMPAKNGTTRIEWHGECELTADDLLTTKKSEGKLEEAKSFLLEVLAEGRVLQKEIQNELAARGISFRTVERAKQLLGITSKREGFGRGSEVYWQLEKEES